jgi:hypothetical protein
MKARRSLGLFLAAAFFLLSRGAPGQTSPTPQEQSALSQQVNPNPRRDPDPHRISLTPQQRRSIRTLLKSNAHQIKFDLDCALEKQATDTYKDWSSQLLYFTVPLHANTQVIMVQSFTDCLLGFKWFLYFDGSRPILLATPEQIEEDYIFSIQPRTSHGYRDLVMGHHMSAGETSLAYLRFDGVSYRLIAGAVNEVDESRKMHIMPGNK